ncbi:MAG: Tripartite tricarboxylate transporter TctB family [Deltaproteobacteria bacterium]|nr:Tripartite tricarboxylate transporter TctB family [Deltaproteobacteria bacterium]
MKRTRAYCNLFWLLFSLIICVEAYRLKIGTIHDPGPGFFPFGAGLIMLLLSLAALLQSVTTKQKVEETSRQETFRWWNIVIILATITAYALSLEKIGFLNNTFVFMSLLLKVVEPQPWKTAVIGGLITTLAANVIFNVIFRTQIPNGILGF